MAKVRFIQTLSTTREVYRRGHTFELPDVEADSYVRNGVAVAVEVVPPTVEKPKAEKPKGKAKGDK